MFSQLTGKELNRSLYNVLNQEAIQASLPLLGVKFVQIRREQNKVAHELAQLGMKSG